MKKVLGLGNALVDIITELHNDELLTTFSLPKGSMTLVDNSLSNEILKNTAHLNQSTASGGSAANTIHGLAKLGINTGFIGKVGQDELGNFFSDDLVNNNITPHLITNNANTGVAVALISKDAERTFATFLGAAIDLHGDDLKEEIFSQYDILYIEGYLVQNHDLMIKALQLAKKLNMEVVIDLASYNVVEENLSFLKMIAKEYAHIIFANEEEAKSFTGLENPLDALNDLAYYAPIAIVKIGGKGSLIKKENTTYIIPPNGEKCIDTTGAGDLFAAGFLYGYIHNLPMDKCGALGDLLAKQVIQEIGAKIPSNKWIDLVETANTYKL